MSRLSSCGEWAYASSAQVSVEMGFLCFGAQALGMRAFELQHASSAAEALGPLEHPACITGRA